jgi:epsilon-lactone hydrolase
MTDTAKPDAIQVTRTIPVPTSVSPEAQAALAAGGLMPRRGPSPALDDRDGWKAQIAATDAGILAAIGPRAADAAVEVDSTTIGGVRVFVLTPHGVDAGPSAPVYLDIHGGALIAGGGDACRAMATQSADRSRMHMWSVDYRMPPDHPYPASLDDCLTVYRALLDHKAPELIAVGGASAGGNLAAALMLRALAEGLPMPACLVLLTPEVDLTESGDTFETNAGVDTVLPGRLGESIALYANGHDLTDPLLSPLFGDLTRFPPTFLQSGTRDLFLSNTVRMHRALRNVGVDAELHVFEAMPHGGFWGAPEDAEMAAELRRFLAQHLAKTD